MPGPLTAWLRLVRSNADDIDNLGGWLTTVVGRVCLDMLRARKGRVKSRWKPVYPIRWSAVKMAPTRNSRRC